MRALIAAAVIAAHGLALAASVTCPIDNASAYFTGETQVDGVTGKLLQKYKCPNGHEFWVVA